MTNARSQPGNASELLPCPFCGAPARDDLLPHSGGPGWVQCSACECSQFMSDTIPEAVARWNTRAPLPRSGVQNGHGLDHESIQQAIDQTSIAILAFCIGMHSEARAIGYIRERLWHIYNLPALAIDPAQAPLKSGFFASLTPDQQKAALEYDGPENHGDPAFAQAAPTVIPTWFRIDTAPRDRFILLYCPEDQSRWLAKWQGDRWYGVDDDGLTRQGASLGDPDVVTGWFVSHWRPLPDGPSSLLSSANSPSEAGK